MSATYQVGDVTITKVPELTITAAPETLYPNSEPGFVEAYRERFIPGSMEATSGKLIQSIHTWVVKTGKHTILIDTATGNDKVRPLIPILDHLQQPYLERLAEVGVTPESVDYVLMTHLHVDHVGWNTRWVEGRWVPTFPNARHLFSRIEQEYYSGPPEDSRSFQGNVGSFEDSVLPVIEAGLAQNVPVDGSEVLEGISFLPTPGHSIDHASIRLVSRGEEALFWGDLLHHQVQVYHPELNSIYCRDVEKAHQSRLWALEYAAESRPIVFSSHFAESSAGIVTRAGDQFEWRFL